MVKRTLLSWSAVLCSSVLMLAACGSKTPPKSTTTTRTQINTENDKGESTASDVKETSTEQPDGSHKVKRVETTNKTMPPANPPSK